jgi:hypothetical protein
MTYYNKKHISNLLIIKANIYMSYIVVNLTMIIGKCYIHALCMVYGVQWPAIV